MRAFTLRILAPLAMGAAIFTAAAPAYAAVTAATAGANHPADVCPLTSHWDNSLSKCVPN